MYLKEKRLLFFLGKQGVGDMPVIEEEKLKIFYMYQCVRDY